MSRTNAGVDQLGFNAVGIAEGWIEATEEQQVEAWQYLHDTGLAYQLQGWFGRTADRLLREGVIHETPSQREEIRRTIEPYDGGFAGADL